MPDRIRVRWGTGTLLSLREKLTHTGCVFAITFVHGTCPHVPDCDAAVAKIGRCGHLPGTGARTEIATALPLLAMTTWYHTYSEPAELVNDRWV